MEGQVLNAHMQVWRDASAEASVAQVAESDAAGLFHGLSGRDFGVTYTRDAIWLKVSLRNPFPQAQTRYLEVGPARLQAIRLYHPDGRGGWTVLQAGMKVPVSERLIHSRMSAFPLEFMPDESQTFYVRIQSGNAIALNLRLWEPQGFHAAERRVDIFNGLQFGALILFIFYALLLYFIARDSAFLNFSIVVASCLMNDVALLQYGHAYLWPSMPEWNLRSPGILGTPIIVAGTFLFLRLMRVSDRLPRVIRVLWGGAFLAVAVVPAMLWLDYAFWVNVQHAIGLFQLSCLMLLTLYCVVKRVEDAVLVLVAFFVTWGIGLMRLAQMMGFLPHDFAIDYSQNWAMLLSGTLVVGLMTSKFRRLNQQRQTAEQSATAARIQARMQAEQDVFLRTRELQMAKEMAEASSRTKSAFLAQLSHELRTPLHGILGYSGLILSDSPDSVLRRRIEAVQHSGRHLLGLIDELLDYARGETGRLRLDMRCVNLRELLESVVEENRLMAQGQGLELSLESQSRLDVILELDRVRLRQVLINLIVNACRHSQGNRVELMAGVEQAGAQIGLWVGVRDNGVGIPERHRERIFQPFERGEPASTAHDRYSLGLGLTIARQLVALMGGELVCESPASGGSLFHFRLLVSKGEGAGRREVPGWSGLSRYKGEVRRILVVDDMPDNRALLADVLNTLGFEVAHAASGPEALGILAQAEADLVITDQIMPGMDGWDLLRLAREQGCTMPFIMLSAAMPVLPDGWDPHRVFAAILMKPTEPDRLAEAIGFALGLEWEPREPAADGVAVLARPAPESLQRLLQAVEQGRVSDIEDWVEEVLVREPGAADFAEAVRESVRRLDLERIRRLVSPV